MNQVMPPDKPHNRPTDVGSPDPEGHQVLPAQSREDTDAGWGERPDLDDTERLIRERPPHWE